MGAVAVTNGKNLLVPLNISTALLTGTVAGAGTATLSHSLGRAPRGYFTSAKAASGTVTINVVSVSTTQVVIELSAACDFQVLLLADGNYVELAVS